MDRLAYVWMAFSITWIAIFVYTLMLGKRQQKLAHELELLRQAIKPKK
ncbi:MAG: CcmD family protein [Bacillota bacterium]